MKCEFCSSKEIVTESTRLYICSKCLLKYYNEIVTTFADRDKKVLKLRMENKTYREIGEVLGVTQERARQLFIKIVKRVIYQGHRKVKGE